MIDASARASHSSFGSPDVIVGIYEVGSKLYLGGTAEDVQPSSTATLQS